MDHDEKDDHDENDEKDSVGSKKDGSEEDGSEEDGSEEGDVTVLNETKSAIIMSLISSHIKKHKKDYWSEIRFQVVSLAGLIQEDPKDEHDPFFLEMFLGYQFLKVGHGKRTTPSYCPFKLAPILGPNVIQAISQLQGMLTAIKNNDEGLDLKTPNKIVGVRAFESKLLSGVELFNLVIQTVWYIFGMAGQEQVHRPLPLGRMQINLL